MQSPQVLKSPKSFLFDVIWRLAILSLPWQIRWFDEAMLGGWPWEQGRVSVYASWILLVLTIFLGRGFRFSLSKKTRLVFILFLLSLSATRGEWMAMRAVAQWWVQVSVLSLFFWTLFVRRVSLRSVMTWFGISMVPYVLLGVFQYSQQFVHGSKWLGMATQDPRQLGVSVVEHGEFRVLRAFGGFPHPNIFGGWLAGVMPIALWLAATAERKFASVLWSLFLGLSGLVLVVTYSRSAWMMGVLGVAFTAWNLWSKRGVPRQFFLISCLSLCAFVGTAVWTERIHIFNRVTIESRLEKKSVNERTEGLAAGFKLFLQRPWVGFGPNTEGLFLSAGADGHAPVQPPHNVLVLVLLGFGLVGTMVLAWFTFPIWKLVWRDPLLWSLIPVFLFDHYVWSFWAGQTLFVLMFFISVCRQRQKREGDSRG